MGVNIIFWRIEEKILIRSKIIDPVQKDRCLVKWNRQYYNTRCKSSSQSRVPILLVIKLDLKKDKMDFQFGGRKSEIIGFDV